MSSILVEKHELRIRRAQQSLSLEVSLEFHGGIVYYAGIIQQHHCHMLLH